MLRHVLPTALVLGALLAPPAAAAEAPFDLAVRADQAHARARLAATTRRVATTAYPSVTAASGLWSTTAAKSWTSGFLPGALWAAYQESGDEAWRTQAQARQAGLAAQASVRTTHDLGFMIFDSFGAAYRLTGQDAFRQTVLKAAASLASRYSPTVGATRSWNSAAPSFQVIVDNLMNLELLFWASKHGGQRAWYDMAVTHALTTARDHVRADGSTYHLVVYDERFGAVTARRTHQGYADGSTWARGQAWAIHGFTMAYRETGDARFLATARRVTDYFMAHLPADRIPYWDFDDPAIPTAPRDTSAAAVAASGLLELARLEPDAGRAARAAADGRAILSALSAPPWLSVGASTEAVLLHGTANRPAGSSDTGVIYGDYYLAEALLRLRRLTPAGATLPVSAATASRSDAGTAPAAALDGSLATNWSGTGDGQWLRLDLGVARPVTAVTVAFARGDERATRFELQASADGAAWRPLLRTIAGGATTARETYDVPDTRARFLRLVGHGAGTATVNAVSEIAVR